MACPTVAAKAHKVVARASSRSARSNESVTRKRGQRPQQPRQRTRRRLRLPRSKRPSSHRTCVHMHVLPTKLVEILIDCQQYFEIRSRKIQELRKSQNPNPYPHKFQVTTDLRDFLKGHEKIKTGEHLKDVEVKLGGRIYTKRAAGSKLVFYDLRAEGVKVQIMCQAQEAAGTPNLGSKPTEPG